MSEVTPQPMQTSDGQEESKKRKADPSLSDLKRDQLAQARLKKQQKAQEREQEMSQLKSKLNDFESKLKDTEQKIVNVEVDKQVQTEHIENPLKTQKIVTAEPEPRPEKKQPGFLENLLNPENLIRTSALIGAAGASYYFKNVWRQPSEPAISKVAKSEGSLNALSKPAVPKPVFTSRTHPSDMPITSLAWQPRK